MNIQALEATFRLSRLLIEVPHELAAVHRIGYTGLVAVEAAIAQAVGDGRVTRLHEHPAVVQVLSLLGPAALPRGVHHAIADAVLEAFPEPFLRQRARAEAHEESCQGAIGPGAGQRHIEMVTYGEISHDFAIRPSHFATV